MDYDLCILGAGWSGFSAAVSAAKRNKKVCLVESQEIGGTCLNRGCIPTKTFVHYSRQGASLIEIQAKKREILARLRTGMQHVVKARVIDYFQGCGVIQGPNEVAVSGQRKISSRYILIATGAQPQELEGFVFDGRRVLSSDGLLEISDLPQSLLVVGGGVIGCEFASIFNRLGSKVTIVELASQLLPGIDGELSQRLSNEFQKAGIEVVLGKGPEGLPVERHDKVLVAIGRRARSEGLWVQGLGIETDRGALVVDRTLKTGLSSVYAAGDCIGGYQLAHVASYEAELAVQNMFDRPQNRDYAVIPSSIFTFPEIGVVGLSEAELKAGQADYRTAKVNFLSVGMAHVMGQTQGFAKVFMDPSAGVLLGACIIGLQATELVNVFSMAMRNRLTISDLRRTVFAHPSVSEIVAEIARSLD